MSVSPPFLTLPTPCFCSLSASPDTCVAPRRGRLAAAEWISRFPARLQPAPPTPAQCRRPGCDQIRRCRWACAGYRLRRFHAASAPRPRGNIAGLRQGRTAFGAGIGRRRFVFLQAIPCAAIRAFAHPFRMDGAAMIAEKLSASFGHLYLTSIIVVASGAAEWCCAP